jgi:hypothetical protein
MRGKLANIAWAVLEKFNVEATISHCTSIEVVNFRLKDAHNEPFNAGIKFLHATMSDEIF